jgi:hypothetical protein
MQQALEWLSGKKTYITAILFAVFNLGTVLNLWTVDDATWKAIDTILGALGLTFLRLGVTKSAPVDDDPKPPQPPPPGKIVEKTDGVQS